MTRNFLVFSLLISFALSSYLPMSMKKHNFGDHICRYTDLDEHIDYVRPCEANKYCQETETHLLGATSINILYTCQNDYYIPPNPTTPLKDIGVECNNYNECKSGLICSIPSGETTTQKCNRDCGTGVTLFPIDDGYKCRIDQNKCISTKNDGTQVGTLPFDKSARKCKVCGEIHDDEEKDGNNKPYRVLKYVDENDLYSKPDGTYVYQKEACESGTALYFYLDGKIKNEITSGNIMYFKCVTIKAVDPDHKRFNYTEGSDKVYIYDIDEVDYDSISKKNEMESLCSKYLMTKVQLWNENRDEYINYLKCTESNEANDNLKRKLYYLIHPEDYLLYKDRTEVIEYLIQLKYHDIVPIITKDSAGALKFKYLILSLMLLFL